MDFIRSCSEGEKLCKKLTQEYDKSHDFKHHRRVLNNVELISIHLIDNKNKDLISDPYRFLYLTTFSALLHDTVDDKYCNAKQKLQKQNEIRSFLNEHHPSGVDDILWIIENISFSKEKKRGHPAKHSDPLVQLALAVVSDGDKLEALGITGIQRMLDFNMGTVVENALSPIPKRKTVEVMASRIKEHTAEKLSLLKDHYIHTVKGKELASSLHDEMMALVNDNSRLFEMIQKDGRFV